MSLEEPQIPPVELSEADARVNGLRVAGAVIDVLLLTGVLLAISAVTNRTGTPAANSGSLTVGLSGGPLLLCLGIWLAYFWILEASFGRTLGKFVCGLRVIDRSGSTPGPGAILIRTLGRIVDALPLCYAIGLISMFTGGLPSRRVGDRLAGTAVIRG